MNLRKVMLNSPVQEKEGSPEDGITLEREWDQIISRDSLRAERFHDSVQEAPKEPQLK